MDYPRQAVHSQSYVSIGEGEYATLDLVNALERSDDGVRLPDPAIPNWWFKLNGEVVRNGLRPLLTSEELDELPFSDRELLYNAHQQSRSTKIKPFITGRGCPYDCAFCFNKAFSDLYSGRGRRFRRRSPDNVIRELKEVTSQHDVRFILFMDDTFILQDAWLNEFMSRYKAEIGLPFWCQVRAHDGIFGYSSLASPCRWARRCRACSIAPLNTAPSCSARARLPVVRS